MMNKMKSAKRNLVRFLFLLPVLSLVLLAFRKETPAGKPGSQYAESASIMFDNSASDVAATPVIADTIPAMITPNSKGYLVNIIDDKGSCMVVIKDKSGKEVERILLAKWKDVKKYEELYGEILLPPPPPPGIDADVPPVPPLPPACAGQTIAGVTPVAIGSNDNVSLSRISSEYEITNKKAVIKLKNGTVENYDLTDKKERAAFEEKYGKLININTNIRTAVNASINSNVNANVNANIATTVIDPVGKTTATGTNVTTIVTPVKFSGGYGTTSATAISSVTAGGVNVIDDEEYVISGKEDILITITRKTTRQELENYKTQMKAKGVELDYDEIEYNDKGMLISISGTLKTSDNRSNFVANDFETLILAMMKKGNRTYFKVSTKDKEVI